MVSHDVEFCAQYADRCLLMFDGSIAAEGGPTDFFAGNHFYTTAANRMARRLLPTMSSTMIISGPAKNTAMMFSLHPRRNRPRPRLVISIVSAFKTKR